MYYFLTTLMCLFFALMIGMFSSGYDMIILSGFADGVGMCGVNRYVAIDKKSIIQYEKGNTFVITKSKMKDKRVRKLKKLTHKTCEERNK